MAFNSDDEKYHASGCTITMDDCGGECAIICDTGGNDWRAGIGIRSCITMPGDECLEETVSSVRGDGGHTCWGDALLAALRAGLVPAAPLTQAPNAIADAWLELSDVVSAIAGGIAWLQRLARFE